MKKRQELPNFQKVKLKVNTEKLLQVYNDNITFFKDKKDFINTSCGVPYLSENGYTQIPVTNFKDASYTHPNPATGIDPEGDERNYRELEEWAKGTYIEEVLSMFSSPTRTRFCVISPGGYIKPHIDYNTDYSVRYQIPITTNDWCYVGVQRKGEKPELVHLPADGSVWFMNQGFNHAAWNMGKTDRIHMVVCVDSQEDLNLE
jgi:hypothetical protein